MIRIITSTVLADNRPYPPEIPGDAEGPIRKQWKEYIKRVTHDAKFPSHVTNQAGLTNIAGIIPRARLSLSPPWACLRNAGDGEILQAIQKFIAEYQELVDKIESLPHEPDWENIKDTIEEHRPEPDKDQIVTLPGDEDGHVEINLDTGEINIEDGDGNEININDGVVTHPDGHKEEIGEDGVVIKDPDGDKEVVIDGDGTVHVPHGEGEIEIDGDGDIKYPTDNGGQIHIDSDGFEFFDDEMNAVGGIDDDGIHCQLPNDHEAIIDSDGSVTIKPLDPDSNQGSVHIDSGANVIEVHDKDGNVIGQLNRPDGESLDLETGAGTIHIDEEGNVHLPTADPDRDSIVIDDDGEVHVPSADGDGGVTIKPDKIVIEGSDGEHGPNKPA